ncbi:hypothetical protein M8J77_002287 [Diaphorina citri]|nr:hypothetical protein M8J77_002287 [Diaphorina citri]
MVPYYLLLFAYQMTLVLTSITRLGPRFWEDIEPKTTKYLGPNGTTMDPEYLDYLLSITQLPAYKLYSANEHWKWTSHHWVVDENFTTDLNMTRQLFRVKMLTSYLVTTLVCYYGRTGVKSVPLGTSLSSGTESYNSTTKLTKWWYHLTQFEWKGTTGTVGWEIDPDFTPDLNCLVNPNQKKNQSRAVVDYAIIDDMKDKNAYCRCWRSKKFPLCDGAHLHHNNRTGDNVGPLLIKDEDALTNSTEFFHYMCNLRKRK